MVADVRMYGNRPTDHAKVTAMCCLKTQFTNNDGADDVREGIELSQCKSLATLHKKELCQVYSDL